MFMRLAIYVSMYIYTYENIHAENADVKSEILHLTSELTIHVKVQMIETDLPVASRFGATLGSGATESVLPKHWCPQAKFQDGATTGKT